jgi:hypothetical protein
LTKHFNKISKKYWAPKEYVSYFISIIIFIWFFYLKYISGDDNIELWKGRHGQHKIIGRKADKIGQVLWEVVDSAKFVFALLWEYEVRVKKVIKLKLDRSDCQS